MDILVKVVYKDGSYVLCNQAEANERRSDRGYAYETRPTYEEIANWNRQMRGFSCSTRQ